MNKVNKIFENEITKFLYTKKLKFIIFFVAATTMLATYFYNDMVNAVAQGLEKTNTYPDELKMFLINLSGTDFMLSFLTDFIYKSVFPFYLIFIAIIAVEVFAEDYQNGTLKFTLLTGVEGKDVILGKFLFMAFVALIISLISFVFSFIVGQLVFGGAIDWNVFLEVLILSVLVVAPTMALTSIIFILAQTNLNTKIITLLGIGFTVVMGILDSLTESIRFSPIGAISMFNNSTPDISAEFLWTVGVSIVYTVVITAIGYNIAKNKDLYK